MKTNVDQYIEQATRWQEEMQLLRTIVLATPLVEEFKWRNPCYTYNQKNVLIIGGFKHYCILGFFKGSLLADTDQILISPGENSQSMNQVRFTNVGEIKPLKEVLTRYIYEAIEVEKAGLKISPRNPNTMFTDELLQKMEELPALKTAFEALSPGRQRAYHLFFSQAKQSKTRISRIEKCLMAILNGKGLNDH